MGRYEAVKRTERIRLTQPPSTGGRGAGHAHHQQLSRIRPIEVVAVHRRVSPLQHVVRGRAQRRPTHVGQELPSTAEVRVTGGRVFQERHPPGDQPPDLIVTTTSHRGRDRRQGIHVRAAGILPAPFLEQSINQLLARCRQRG